MIADGAAAFEIGLAAHLANGDLLLLAEQSHPGTFLFPHRATPWGAIARHAQELKSPSPRKTLPLKSVLARKLPELTEAETSRPEHSNQELAAVSPYVKVGQGRTARLAPTSLLGTASRAGRPGPGGVLGAVTSRAGIHSARLSYVTGRWTSRLVRRQWHPDPG